MTKRQTTKAYAEHDRLLHLLSHRCAARCGRPEEDCYGQACYLFMRAASTYTPERGKLSTWVYLHVRNGLVDWGKRNDLPVPMPEGVEPATHVSPARALEIKDWLANLSTECREVATLIINGPAEILEYGPGRAGNQRRIGSKAILRYMVGRGWGWVKARHTLRQLKAAVAEL